VPEACLTFLYIANVWDPTNIVYGPQQSITVTLSPDPILSWSFPLNAVTLTDLSSLAGKVS
jgi:hypothetical protein